MRSVPFRHSHCDYSVVCFVAGLAAQGMRGGTRIAPGQECPPGTTEVRPGSCQAPSTAPPSILDYRPQQHAGHRRAQGAEGKVPGRSTCTATRGSYTAGLDQSAWSRSMDPLNLRVLMLVADNVCGDRPDAARWRRSTRRRTRIASACSRASTSTTSVRAGASRRQQLEADLKAGAMGVGEVGKQFGLADHQARWLTTEGRRSRARSAVGGVRAARCAGVHPHRRTAGVLPAAGHQERTLARAVAVRGSPQQPAGPGRRSSS